MKLKLVRAYKKDKYTIGRLYIDGELFANTLEDKDRGLTLSMPLSEIKNKKVYALTAIPTGTYEITLNVISPKFGVKSFYKNYANGGRLPRLLNVPGFDGILIHAGTDENSTSGCVLVGFNTIKGKLTSSLDTFKKLYKILQSSKDKITIEIV